MTAMLEIGTHMFRAIPMETHFIGTVGMLSIKAHSIFNRFSLRQLIVRASGVAFFL
jgi:hypothetical protein